MRLLNCIGSTNHCLPIAFVFSTDTSEILEEGLTGPKGSPNSRSEHADLLVATGLGQQQ